MALTNHKVGDWASPVVNEADKPKRSAAEMKAVFDANSNQLKEALNALIDELTTEGGADIGMPQLSEGVPAGKLPDQLRAVLDEALDSVKADDIVAIRLNNVNALEVTLDGVTWKPIAMSDDPVTDVGALPVADDIQPPDGFLMYDASAGVPRRALWDKIRSSLASLFLAKSDYAAETAGAVKLAKNAEKLSTPHLIGSAAFDGTADITLADMGAAPHPVIATNVLVEIGSWEYDETFVGYEYRAGVPVDGATASMLSLVTFAPAEADSGNYSGQTAAYNGGIYIYAKAMPEEEITLLSVILFETGGET